MLRLMLAATLLLTLSQEMPIVRLAGPQGSDRGQTPAQQPQPQRPPAPLPPLPATEIDAASAAAALDAPRRIVLTFAEPRPIDEEIGRAHV